MIKVSQVLTKVSQVQYKVFINFQKNFTTSLKNFTSCESKFTRSDITRVDEVFTSYLISQLTNQNSLEMNMVSQVLINV